MYALKTNNYLVIIHSVLGVSIVDDVVWDSFNFFFAWISAWTSSIVRLSRLFSLGTKMKQFIESIDISSDY